MAKSQVERNAQSRAKLGLKQKSFTLDSETIALFETLAAQTNQTQVQVLKNALKLYAGSLNA